MPAVALTNVLAVGIQWQSPQMLGVALLVGVLIVLAVGLLYPAQVRLLPAPWRVALPALRCAALLALAVSLGRPVAQRAIGAAEQGAVVILVDASRSMDVRDTLRRPANLVALADGMGRIAPNLRSRGEGFAPIASQVERLPELLKEISQAQVELEIAQFQGRENPEAQKQFDELTDEFKHLTQALLAARGGLQKSPQMAAALAELKNLPPTTARNWASEADKRINVILERAGQFQTESDEALYNTNTQVKAVCDQLKRLTRFELVEDALVHPHDGLLARLPAGTPLFGFAIGPRVLPLPLRGAGGRSVGRIVFSPDGARSDLTGGLRDVMDRLRHQNVQAVVLFSDGRQVGAETSIASSLMGSGIPVYALCPAPLIKEREPLVRDLAIAKVTLPQSVFVGETLNVAVDLRWTQVDKSKLPEVTMQVGAERQVKRIEPKRPGATTATVVFALPVVEPGPQRVTISLPSVEGEISDENNTVTRWVKVVSDKFDALLVGGSASWDFRYLRNALQRTPSISAQAVLLDGENQTLRMPAEQILARDVVILCDMPARGLAPDQWEAVRKMVVQRGGSLLLLAGQAHLPREYTGEYLSEFLPYRRSAAARGGGTGPVWRVWPGEEPEFRVVPPPNAPMGDVLALADDAQASADRWIALPPVFRFLALPDLKEVAQPLLVERGTGAPVLTRQRLGRGKVFFLGIDETWRWRNKVGERDQDRFFRQLVRAAADEPYAVSNGSLALDADRVTIAPGESVRVRARVIEPTSPATSPSASQSAADGVDVDVVRDDVTIRTTRLAPVGDADSGRYIGTIGDLDEGDYRLRLRAPATDTASELDYPLHVTRSYEAEMANLAPDDTLLRRLASSSGGQFWTLEQFKELPARLADLREHEPRTAELRLWSSWYLYAFVLACLGGEWALRKRFGLS
jgi:hypothetical protein